MKLYLARHGEYVAEGLGQSGSLSGKGRNDIEQIANLIYPSHIKVKNIFHSGKHRAEQTAQILAKSFISMEGVNVYPGINPEDDVSLLAKAIDTWRDDVLLVGHLPFMMRLVSKLIVNDEKMEMITFQPGSIVCLERIEHKWMINWMLSLDLLPTK